MENEPWGCNSLLAKSPKSEVTVWTVESVFIQVIVSPTSIVWEFWHEKHQFTERSAKTYWKSKEERMIKRRGIDSFKACISLEILNF